MGLDEVEEHTHDLLTKRGVLFCRIAVGLSSIMASITCSGLPGTRTCRVVRDTEPFPRKVYRRHVLRNSTFVPPSRTRLMYPSVVEGAHEVQRRWDGEIGAPIKISDELVEAAKQAAAKRFRSLPKQIECWAHLGRQLEARQARRLKELDADPYADLDACFLESDDGGAEVVREQQEAGVPVWGYDDVGNLVST